MSKINRTLRFEVLIVKRESDINLLDSKCFFKMYIKKVDVSEIFKLKSAVGCEQYR